MRLHGAVLFVKDLERMTAFYRVAPGLEPIAETRLNNWVEFKGDGVRFSLHTIPASIAAGITIESPPHVRENGGTKHPRGAQRRLHSKESRISGCRCGDGRGEISRPSIPRAISWHSCGLPRVLPLP